jgi:carotenoid 1,2-hydratase
MTDEPIETARPIPAQPLDFAAPVPQNGYRWWYLDGVSDDLQHAVTIIGFVGSVFSPYYVAARRRGAGDPADHAALNVALYGAGGHRWAMTERSAARCARTPERYRIGPSAMEWEGGRLRVAIDEWCFPLPSPIRGDVLIEPAFTTATAYALGAGGGHVWHPFAPVARIKLRLGRPALAFEGHGYFDINWGDEPIEAGFRRWDWSRAMLNDGGTAALYDAERRDGRRVELALRFRPDGAIEERPLPPAADLPPTAIWRIPRRTRSAGPAKALPTLEDTPFYARSLIEIEAEGQRAMAVHESLDLDRFMRRSTQWMLPFRMPRRR